MSNEISPKMIEQAEAWRAKRIALGDRDAAAMSVENCWLEADTEWVRGRAVPGKFAREMARMMAAGEVA